MRDRAIDKDARPADGLACGLAAQWLLAGGVTLLLVAMARALQAPARTAT